MSKGTDSSIDHYNTINQLKLFFANFFFKTFTEHL